MSLKIVIVFFAVATSLVFFGLIIAIVFLNFNFSNLFKRQNHKFLEEKKALELQFLKAQIFTMEEERERIAQSFHDDINPLLAALKLQLIQLFADNNVGIEKNIKYKEVRDLINKIIENQNVAIRNLTPRIENVTQLSCAIHEYLNCIKKVEISFEKEIEKEIQLELDIFNNIYSIFLELMHNLIKHADSTELKVFFRMDIVSLELILTHNGVGLTNSQYLDSIKLKQGRGLSSIQSRLNYIGAKMHLHAAIDFAIIQIKLPL